MPNGVGFLIIKVFLEPGSLKILQCPAEKIDSLGYRWNNQRDTLFTVIQVHIFNLPLTFLMPHAVPLQSL